MALALIWILIACIPSKTVARIPAPDQIPIDRLLKNAEDFIEKNPSDPKAYYVLGRIHHLAFLRGYDVLPVPWGNPEPRCPEDPYWGRNTSDARTQLANQLAVEETGLEKAYTIGAESMSVSDWERLNRSEDKHRRALELEEWMPNVTLNWKTRLDHGENALKCFRTAMRLDLEGSLYPLALASFAEDLDRVASRVRDLKLPPTLQRLAAKEIRSLFRRSYTLARPLGNDWKKWCGIEFGMQRGYHVENFTVFVEAGQAFVRNATKEGAHLSQNEKAFLHEVRTGLAKRKEFDEHNPGFISPIIFSFTPVAGIDELLAPQRSVTFDLAGYGGDHRWPWVKPATGFLVWDPSHTGRITSGRQMFGTYTFGIPWENGYRALASLDDNGDGVLTGEELRGIAVWFDNDGDGRSKPGDVISVEDLGIVAVAVRETGREGIHPTNGEGITLSNGQRLRTWDWFASPHR